MNDLFSFEINSLTVVIKEGQSLAIWGETNCKKSMLLENVYNRKNGAKYRGIVTRYTPEENALFKSEIGYFDGNLYGDPEEPISVLISNAAHIFSVEPKQILKAFEIAADDLKLKFKEADNWLTSKLGLLNVLSDGHKLVFLDDIFGLDYGFKRNLVPMLLMLKSKLNINYVVSTTDMEFAGILTDNMLVLCLGEVVEYGKTQSLISSPMHPYTKWLVDSSKLTVNRDNRFYNTKVDEKPNRKCCKFCSMCPRAIAECRAIAPKVRVTASGSYCACHLQLS